MHDGGYADGLKQLAIARNPAVARFLDKARDDFVGRVFEFFGEEFIEHHRLAVAKADTRSPSQCRILEE